jgi:membrane-associated PAP2 superfamily phosphatase
MPEPNSATGQPPANLSQALAHLDATLVINPATGTLTLDTDQPVPPELVDLLRQRKAFILASLNPPEPVAGPGACIPAGHGLPWTGTVVTWALYRLVMPDERVALAHWTGIAWRWTVWPNGPKTEMTSVDFEQLVISWGHAAPVLP